MTLTVQRDRLLANLRASVEGMREPVSFLLLERFGRDPFIMLISCILSLRTKDAVTHTASLELFKQAPNAATLAALPVAIIERLIYPVGFYRKKAIQIKKISQIVCDIYQGSVPADREKLLALPGVGSKTASLVLGVAFQIPAICVDIHVHRIANRLGLCVTTTPEETEKVLMELFAKDTWIELNRLLVMLGQNICVPVAPHCSRCPLATMCLRRGVTKSR